MFNFLRVKKNSSKSDRSLINVLERLVGASETGNFDIRLNTDSLNQEDAEAVRLITEALNNYKSATEYNLLKYRLTSDALSIALWDMDVVDGDPINPLNKFTWSQEFRTMLGFSGEYDFPNLLHSWSDRLHPEDKERTLNAFAAHLTDRTGQTPYDIIYRLMLKNGEYRYFRAFGTTLRDTSGVPIRVAGALENIDEKIRTQSQLAIMSSIVQNSPNFIAYKKIDGDCLYVNPAASVLSGYSEEELLADYLGLVFDKDVADQMRVSIPAKLKEKGAINYDIDAKRKDGTAGTYRVTTFPVGDDAFASIASDVTEIKQMEREIAATRERYDRMMDASPFGYTFWDQGINVVDCNEATVNLYGVKSKQDYIENFHTLSPEYQPDGELSSDKAKRLVDVAFSEGRVVFEWMHQKPDGTPLPSEITLVRVNYGDGYAVVGYTRDLRNRKRLEAAIQESHDRTRILLDTTPLCCQLWDRNGRMIDCNEEAVKLFGLKNKQEFIEDFYKFSPEYQPNGRRTDAMAAELLEEAFTTGRGTFVWEYHLPDGTIIPAEGVLVRIKYKDDYAVAVYTRDLRELHKKEAALAREREEKDLRLIQVNAVVQAAKMGLWDMWIVKDDPINPMNAFKWSDEFRLLLGYSNEDDFPDVFSSWSNRIHPDDFGMVMDCFEKHMLDNTGQTPYDIEYRIFKKNGDCTYIRDFGNIIHDENGNAVRVAGAIEDISERRQVAETLKEALSAAQKASRVKSEFLSRMSHEIRTPISGVIGLSNLLSATSLDPKQCEYTRMIQISGQMLLSLIDDMFDFSKIESGELELVHENFDMLEMFESVIGLLLTRIEENNIELCISFESGVPRRVIGDLGRTRQVFLHIISNAVKFTENGVVTVHVAVEEYRTSQILIRFTVKDTGIGIPEERLAHLFDTFYQVDDSSSRGREGVGLGLPIAKKLVGLLQGEIGVESTLGQGSTFWFRIPLECDCYVINCHRNSEHKCVKTPADACEINGCHFCFGRAHRRMTTNEDFQLTGKRALVTDDMELVCQFIGDQLASWGMVPEMAMSPSEVLEKLLQAAKERNPYSLLVIGQGSKENDNYEAGKDLIRHVRETPMTKDIAIVLLEPHSAEFEQEFLAEYPVGYVRKPIFVSELLDAVMNQLFQDYAVESEKFRESVYRRSGSDSSVISIMQGSFHILIAEDNKINQIVIQNVLQKAGMTCELAGNGKIALDAVMAGQFDAVLMDLQMPEMDGYEAAAKIRQWEQENNRQRIPIIALTANAFLGDEEQCLEAGMDAYCTKPVDANVVIPTIEHWHKLYKTKNE
jgi:PAS domain S-box-containing protein